MELRKRKAPPAPAPPPPTPKRASAKKGAAGKKGAAPAATDGAAGDAGPAPVAGVAATSVAEPTTAAAEEPATAAATVTADATAPATTTLPLGTPATAAPAATAAPTVTLTEATPSSADASASVPPPQTAAGSVDAGPATTTGAPPADAPATTDPELPPVLTTTNTLGPAPSATSGPPQPGDMIDVATFGGSVQLEDGTTTSLADLLSKSAKGVVIFTYPKASTPGCTKQACLFRDNHAIIATPTTGGGFAVYGLSRDSPKSNTTFKTKNTLPYNLICDVEGTLLKALGFAKAPKSAVRGVAVISKEGKIIGRMEGGPEPTLEAAKKLIEGASGSSGSVEGAAQKL